MKQDDLSATHFVGSRLVTFALVATGLFFLFQPDWMGWSWMADRFGGERGLLGAGLAFALFTIAALSFEKNQMRVQIAELLVALNQLLYGKNYVAEREVIETMILSLENGGETAQDAHKHLVRLTGQNFAADPKVWRSWWTANRAHFELKRQALARAQPDEPAEAEAESED